MYEEKIFLLSVTVAKEAAKRKVKRFIEVSTAQVYESGKVFTAPFFILRKSAWLEFASKSANQVIVVDWMFRIENVGRRCQAQAMDFYCKV